MGPGDRHLSVLQNVPFYPNKGILAAAGGEYVVLANPVGADAQTWLRVGHTAITRVLLGIASTQGSGTLDQQAASDAAFCLEHIARGNPDIYQNALKLMSG